MIAERVTLRFSDIFNEQPKSLKEYLSGISRKRLLNAGAFFLGFRKRGSKYERYNPLLQMFFSAENYDLAKHISDQAAKVEAAIKKQTMIINTQSSLELFEYCFDNLTEDDIQTPKEGEANIFKAILLINQQITEKEMTAFSSTKDVEQPLKIAAPFLSQGYPYFDLVNYMEDSLFAGQIIKGAYLLDFLESNNQTKPLYQKFIDHFNCKDGKEYLVRILTLMHSVVISEKEAHTDIVVTKDEMFDIHCQFIEKLSLADDEALKDLDYRKIRSNPLYKIEEGIYRIIFHLFLSDKLYKGIYFKLRELNDMLDGREKISDLRSVYSFDFSERYLFYKMMERIYDGRFIKFTGDEISRQGIDGGPDYYIRSADNVLLFESKDIFIEAGIKSSYDFKLYESEFRKKLYYKTTKDNKKVNKAVVQLINNVRRVLKKEFAFDRDYKEATINIYPVLVLYDYQFNIPGLNVLINHWFITELEKLKGEALNIENVRPLVIIDIDTIIRYQDVLQNPYLSLEAFIDCYLNESRFDWKKKRKNESEAIEALKLTLMPFSLFLKNFSEKYGIAAMPQMVLDIGHSLLPNSSGKSGS
jgi:hypothetical protein